MKLYEFEGHKILSQAGIESPNFVVCKSADEVSQLKGKLKFPVIGKVQVLSGKRGKHGGVKVLSRLVQAEGFAKEHLGKDFLGEEVIYILFAQKANFAEEFYISINYDTVLRTPFVLFSEKGGMEVEELAGESMVRVDIDPEVGPKKADFKNFPVDFEFVEKLWGAFSGSDARLVEINPLAKTAEGRLIALDAKVILDDNGMSRHEDLEVIPKGVAQAVPTKRELAAKKIDEGDYRGSAGSAFIDLDGDIAVLASGGGASLLVMDALAASGGKPANYTEYSGNPSAEKVEKLTKIALDKKGLSGCLVAGAFANFTDIYETLSGFAKGLSSANPKVNFPIVVRRGGPRQAEAYEMLRDFAKKEGFDIHLFGPQTPISVAATKMVELSEKYKLTRQSIKASKSQSIEV